jgi:hypothetical protein
LDLQEERKQVIQALLELDCIPCGMELFQASDDDQWTLIKRVIDDCDYYLVIISGRYGSTKDGISYTEMEYDYAISQNKPVIAFLHQKPGDLKADLTEKSPEGLGRLQEFRRKAELKTCRYWQSPEELGGQVSRSYVKLIKDKPAEGWVKARYASSPEEVLRLRERIEELEQALKEARTQPPVGSETLAQGSDWISFKCTYRLSSDELEILINSDRPRHEAFPGLTWDDLFCTLGPSMFHECSEDILKRRLENRLREAAVLPPDHVKIEGFTMKREDFETVTTQLLALGLIKKSVRPRSVKDSGTYWTLTPYGETYAMKLKAVKRIGG